MTWPPDLIVKQFWPTIFYQRPWPDHAVRAPALIELLYALKAQASANIASGVAPAAKSSQGLFESDFDLFANSDANLQALRGFFDETVRLAVSHVNGGRIDPARLQVEFRDSWCHITNGGGFHDAHTHGGCSWCGIFYVRAGDSGRREGTGAPNGINRFYSPLGVGGAYRDIGNEYLNATYIDPPPRDGNLILFPSYLWHSALPYRGDVDRIIISFNSRIQYNGG